MAREKSRLVIIVTTLGAIIAMLVGGKQLGCVWPHEALAKSDAAKTYETQEDADMTRVNLLTTLQGIEGELRAINACLRTRTCGTVSEPAP